VEGWTAERIALGGQRARLNHPRFSFLYNDLDQAINARAAAPRKFNTKDKRLEADRWHCLRK
jgi:hypothetical protein